MSRPRSLTKIRCATAPRIPRLNQNYNSYEHDSSPSYNPEEDVILAAAIKHVPAHGFTSTALSSGIRDAGYPDVSANLFPEGVFSLVKYHLVTERLALSRNAPGAASTASGSVLDMVRHLTLQRLQANRPIIHRWQEVCCPGISIPRSHIKYIEADQECRRLQFSLCPNISLLLCANSPSSRTRSISLLATKASILRGTPSAQGCPPSTPARNCS